MNKKALVIGLMAAISSGVAVAGGTSGATRYEPAAQAPVQQAPVVQQQAQPAPAPVVQQTTVARTPAPVVVAAVPRNYVGVGVGRAESDLAGTDDDTVGKIFAGTNFNQNLGAELTYQDLGDIGGDDDNGAVSLAAIGRLPVMANTNVFGKVGGYHKLDSDFGDDNGVLYGVGAEFGFTPNLAARAEWERLQDAAANAAGDEEDVDVASLSLVYKF